MTLTIKNTDFTGNLLDGTLTIRRYGALRSSFFAKITVKENQKTPKVGEEITVTDNGTVLWGGILIETEIDCHSTQKATVTLRGQGYEQILNRFCLPFIVLDEMTPTEATTYIFNNYIPPEDGISLGSIEPGPGLSNAYRFYPAKASSIFDYLAKENGYFWWVDENKAFQMRAMLPLSASNRCIDLTGQTANRIFDLQTLTLRSSTAGYRNVQYAFNKNNGQYYKAYNTEEHIRMKERYGSGQYGAATNSSLIQSQTDAQILARQMLSNAPGTDEIEFTTDMGSFALGQSIAVTAPVCGIETPQNFIVSETKAVYFANKFRYTIIANQTAADSIATFRWEQSLAGTTSN